MAIACTCSGRPSINARKAAASVTRAVITVPARASLMLPRYNPKPHTVSRETSRAPLHDLSSTVHIRCASPSRRTDAYGNHLARGQYPPLIATGAFHVSRETFDSSDRPTKRNGEARSLCDVASAQGCRTNEHQGAREGAPGPLHCERAGIPSPVAPSALRRKNLDDQPPTTRVSRETSLGPEHPTTT